MPSTHKLKRAGRWEVDLLPSLSTGTGPDLTLLVVEAPDRIRHLGVIGDRRQIPKALERAARGGQPDIPPARPRTIECRAGLREAVARGARALGATVRVRDTLPLVERVRQERVPSWDGPPRTWPPASTVLLDFAAPFLIPGMPPAAAEQALKSAAAVWSTVVLADVKGDPSMLALARSNLARDPVAARMIETLITRKRQRYPMDTRLMEVSEVTDEDGQLRVSVTSTLAG